MKQLAKCTAILLCLSLIGIQGYAQGEKKQSKTYPLVISLLNTSTLLPGAGKLGIWGTPVHPGFSVGTEFRYNSAIRNEWFQTLKFAYSYHKYAQHSLLLFSELGYRRHFSLAFDVEARLGLGYLHAIPDAQIFVLGDNGTYNRKHNLGRPQGMGSFSLGLGYTFNHGSGLRVFIAEQFYMQAPFVNEYVPLLPSSVFHLGVAFPFFHASK